MRAFVAITLPDATRRSLAAASGAFRDAAPEWAGEKWVPEENLHVTVEFIGQLSDETVPAVMNALELACSPLRPFTLSVRDVVAKPGGSRPRMLWARFADGIEPARELASGISTALAEAIGLEPEKRPYTPHVTLVRFRVPRRVPEGAVAAANAVLDAIAPSCGTAGGPSPLFVSVRHVTLMSSRLSRRGPTYEEVASVPL
ncbi:MAG TPA: RNA 2',3'-cyclic phosphodiesterase [Coriobacteriia bacterium]|jgi:2'-5' RNA ligase